MFEQELNKYWKTVVDTIQDGVMIVDTKGTITSVNRAFETITGHSRTEIIGKPCTILSCNACELIRGSKGITNESLDLMIQYPWPGNVRELKSTLEYAFVACQGSMIAPEHLPPNILHMEIPHETSAPSSVGLNEIKKRRLMDALQQSGGNQSEAARILGISRTSVWNQMKRFNINFKRVHKT